MSSPKLDARWSPWSVRDTPSLVAYEQSLPKRDTQPTAPAVRAPRFTCGMILDACLMMQQKRQQQSRQLSQHQIVRSSPSRVVTRPTTSQIVHRVRQPSGVLTSETSMHPLNRTVVSTIHRAADAPPSRVVQRVTSHGAVGGTTGVSAFSTSSLSRDGYVLREDGALQRREGATYVLSADTASPMGTMAPQRAARPVTAPATRSLVSGSATMSVPHSTTQAPPPPVVVRRAEDWQHLADLHPNPMHVKPHHEHIGALYQQSGVGAPSPWRMNPHGPSPPTPAPWPAPTQPAPQLSYYYDASGEQPKRMHPRHPQP